jgi:TRAP-type C4-dicarboxylate transport system permease small subunit
MLLSLCSILIASGLTATLLPESVRKKFPSKALDVIAKIFGACLIIGFILYVLIMFLAVWSGITTGVG